MVAILVMAAMAPSAALTAYHDPLSQFNEAVTVIWNAENMPALDACPKHHAQLGSASQIIVIETPIRLAWPDDCEEGGGTIHIVAKTLVFGTHGAIHGPGGTDGHSVQSPPACIGDVARVTAGNGGNGSSLLIEALNVVGTKRLFPGNGGDGGHANLAPHQCRAASWIVIGGRGGDAGDLIINGEHILTAQAQGGSGGDANATVRCESETIFVRGESGGYFGGDGESADANHDGCLPARGLDGVNTYAFGGRGGQGAIGGHGGDAMSIAGPGQTAQGSEYDNGGRGGSAVAIGGAGARGATPGDGGSATAVGGNGGSGRHAYIDSLGLGLPAGGGGHGGLAHAVGGSGGNSDGDGGAGGPATATGGSGANGGDGLYANGVGGTGGSGGNAHADAGAGGEGRTLSGGLGGAATMTGGDAGCGGNGTVTPGRDGSFGGGLAVAGNGGAGGLFGGAGGDASSGTGFACLEPGKLVYLKSGDEGPSSVPIDPEAAPSQESSLVAWLLQACGIMAYAVVRRSRMG